MHRHRSLSSDVEKLTIEDFLGAATKLIPRRFLPNDPGEYQPPRQRLLNLIGSPLRPAHRESAFLFPD